MNPTDSRYHCPTGIIIDPALRAILKDGETIRPRPRTFDLLLYLIERRDRIVSRQELLDALWPGTVVTDNSIMQCVNELRRALGDDSRNPRFILTVAKAGYQFIAPLNDPTSVSTSDPTPPNPPPPPAPPPPPRSDHRRWLGLIALLCVAALAALLYRGFSRQVAGRPLAEVAWWRPTPTQPFPLPKPGASTTGETTAEMPRGPEPRTLVASFRTSARVPDSMVLFQFGDPIPDAGTDRFALMLDARSAAAFGTQVILHGRRPLADGEWHQIAGVFEGGSSGMLRVYVDGVEDSAPISNKTPLQPSRAGQWSVGNALSGSMPFRGTIDDVRLYGRALRATQVLGLYRCQTGQANLSIGSETHWLGPIHGEAATILPAQPDQSSPTILNTGTDFAGAILIRRDPACPLPSFPAANLGQNLTISAELLVNAPPGKISEAGPFFRSRRANPGDGIMGGASAGFWVQLDSTGQVRVRRLNPLATIAFTTPDPSFDRTVFHQLSITAQGPALEVTLDGRPLQFDVSGKQSPTVPLDSAWDSATPRGNNNGAAGIAFSSDRNRGEAGGQQARNLRFTRLDPPPTPTR